METITELASQSGTLSATPASQFHAPVMVLNVNKRTYRVAAPPDSPLLEVLRDHLGLTGAKYGCGMGECGACTVLLDGEAVYSCLTLAVEAQGREITTIEGLDRDGELDPLQRAFADTGGVQCGFCTPGMILSARALLDRNHSPTEEEIRRALSGNLCRCTGYMKIVEAVQAAANHTQRGTQAARAGGVTQRVPGKEANDAI